MVVLSNRENCRFLFCVVAIAMTNKSYKTLKAEFLHEVDFVTNIGYKVFVYPFTKKPKLSVYCYNFTYFSVLVTSAQLFISLCVTKFQDWFEIVNIAPNLAVCLMILIKYSKMQTRRNVYENVLKHFKFDLWDIIADTKQHKVILERYTKTSRLIVRFQYYYTIILVLIVIMFPKIISLYEEKIVHNDAQYLYPFDGWYPFDKVKWYYAAYAWESIMTTVVIFIYVFANMVHISFTRYICMELKILGSMMEDIVTTEEVLNLVSRRNVKLTHERIRRKLKLVIKRHQYLAGIVADLDDVLGDGFLLTYSFGSVFICLTILTATVVDNLYLRMRYASFFLSLLVEVFVQCIIGQLLIDHSSKLERAIYFADWPYADQGTKRILHIFLIRAQKPLIFSARGYVTMNLDTFSNICSLSYQFFNLLRTAYS